MSRPLLTLVIDGRALKASFAQVTQATDGPSVRLSVRPISPTEVVVKGSLLSASAGLQTADGASVYPLVSLGRVVSVSRTGRKVQRGRDRAPESEVTLEIAVDAADRRLAAPPPAEETTETIRRPAGQGAPTQTNASADDVEPLTVKELGSLVYRDRLAFTSFDTNVPNFEIDPSLFRLSPTSTYHGFLQSLLGPFEPLWSYRGGDVVAWDLRRPLPTGLPTRSLGPAQYAGFAWTEEHREPVNWVVVESFTRDEAQAVSEAFDVRETLTDSGFSPDGFPVSRSWEIWHDYHGNPLVPAEVTRSVLVGKKTRTFNAEGDIVFETRETDEFEPGTGETVPKRSTSTKYARAKLPGGEYGLLLVRETIRETRNLYDPKRKEWDVLREDSRDEGLILVDDNVPLDEGSRADVVLDTASQDTEWGDIEHEVTTYQYLESANVTRRTYERWDDLAPGGMLEQRTEFLPGRRAVKSARPTKTKERRDEVSIAADGLRPQVTLDARAYGETLGDEIVTSHIFAHNAQPVRTARVPLKNFDPSWYRGELVTLTDHEGAAYYCVVTGYTHTVEMTAEGPAAATELVLRRLEVA